MIFIILVGFVALVIGVLNIMDSSNLEKIKSYLEAKECTTLYYAQGSYKALCPEDIRVVSNSFSLDIANNEKMIKYDTIVQLERKKRKIVFTLIENRNDVIEFKNEEDAKEYVKKLEEKL